MNKAKADELIVCMPKMTGFAKDLKAAGAEICTYSNANYDPGVRFTIREFKRAGARVAVARSNENLHVIKEYDSSGHFIFYLASDLVDLVRSQKLVNEQS